MPYVTLPVIDLRREPKDPAKDFSHDDLRESQLLYGEEVKIIHQEGDWLKVEAVEQFNYPGFVHVSEITDLPRRETTHVVCALMTPYKGQLLSYGTELTPQEAASMDQNAIRPIPKAFDPALFLSEAKLFLDAPYLWGGRCAPLPEKIASVDCSGLINLLYRAQGKKIPRNAHEQCTSAASCSLKPGASIYLRKKERFNHVVVYLSDNLCLESPETGKKVKYSTMKWESNRLQVEGRDPTYFDVKMF